MYRIRILILVCLVGFASSLFAEQDELCMDGTLLFREDFGGNDVNDPMISYTPVASIDPSYIQIHNWGYCEPDCNENMHYGRYLVAKRGYRNSNDKNHSAWHIMDDHTYPNDTTRGYLLEIDGGSSSVTFYETEIHDLCPGSRLTFSAYVANVTTAAHHVSSRSAHPKLSFILSDPETGQQLARYDTDTIPPDWSLRGQSWKLSAQWHLVGMNFEVPEGVDAVRMSIINNVDASTGNDFALDDIEIRLCAPPVTIIGPTKICQGEPATLMADFTNDGTFTEPLEYKWWYSADSVIWTEMETVTGDGLRITGVQKTDAGWYKVAVSGEDNIARENCRAMSEPFHLTVGECTLEETLCMDGTLLFREDFGGNDPSDPRVQVPPEGERSTVPGMSTAYTQLKSDAFRSMGSGKYLVTKSGYCNGDTSATNAPQNRFSQWHIQDDHTYPNDYTRGYFLEIDGRGDNAAFYTKTIDGLCARSRLTFSAYVVNVMTWGMYEGSPGKYLYPRLKFVLTGKGGNLLKEYSTGDIPYDPGPDSSYVKNRDISAWQHSAEWQLVGMDFIVPDDEDEVTLTIYNNLQATYNIGNDFAIDDIEIRLCMPQPEIVSDKEACLDSVYQFAVDFANDGTLVEPLEYKWWFSADSLTWTEKPDLIGKNPELVAVQKSDSGWYKVAVSSAGNIESVNCRAMSEPFLLQTVRCKAPAVYLICDTTACHEDQIVFHGLTFEAPTEYRDTIFDPERDTIYHVTVTDKRSFREMSITIIMGNPPPHPWENVTESGVYRDTLVNAAGCDSIVTCSIYFKERCKEFLEESHTFCSGENFLWHGRAFRNEGDFRDTLWHAEPEACDTAFVLHLEELPVPKDTTFATIHYGDEYAWEGDVWSEPVTETKRYDAANGCDSLKTLQLTVDYSLTVEQMDLESGCSEGEQIALYLQLSRLVDSARFTFSDEAKAAGMRDTIVYFHAKEATIFVPRRGVHPGTFTCEVALVHDADVLSTASFSFTLLYSASVLEQAWNDVVAVLTHDFNGGYNFAAYQWYENGELLIGETHSYLYRPLIMGGEYSALLTETDGTQSMTCPLIAEYQKDISLYPTILKPQQMIQCHVSQEAELWLYDALGRVVGHYPLPEGDTYISAPGATGVYIACFFTRADHKHRPYKLLVQ